MRIQTLQATLLDFARNPAKSWGDLPNGEQFLDGKPTTIAVEQSDRNTARMLSGTFTPGQLSDFESQCARIERDGYGTAVFDPVIPTILVCAETCTHCGKPFATSLAHVRRCYDCELKRLCPPLPGRRVSHWWHHDVWTLQVHGDVGFHNQITFWWYNHNTGSNVGHQGLVANRDATGAVTKLVFTTAAEQLYKRYRIVFDLQAETVEYFVANRASVNDDEYTPPATKLEAFEPLVMDFIMAMLPPFVVYVHRPRSAFDGCFVV